MPEDPKKSHYEPGARMAEGTAEISAELMRHVEYGPCKERPNSKGWQTAALVLETDEQRAQLSPRAREIFTRIWDGTDGMEVPVPSGERGPKHMEYWIQKQVEHLILYGETVAEEGERYIKEQEELVPDRSQTGQQGNRSVTPGRQMAGR